ncbi:hypothetical protein ILYODFUR_025107 [Ilyodon furcidens]|uniref:Uncharacterized protein n=1 Tax=Ilyodon furcidens TaxID=33524 RepID=A0ABV0VIE4_9TELE
MVFDPEVQVTSGRRSGEGDGGEVSKPRKLRLAGWPVVRVKLLQEWRKGSTPTFAQMTELLNLYLRSY